MWKKSNRSTWTRRVTVVLTLLVLAAGRPAAPAHATGAILYVTQGGGGGGCDSWEHSCVLQYALGTAATPGDSIWVQTGTYYPGALQSDTFTLRNGVSLYGGFLGNETELTQRDWVAHPSVLSGYTGTPGNNSFHVVTASGTNNTALLDGFTITQGIALDSPPNDAGAGMVNAAGSPTLVHVTFTNNGAISGAGMLNQSGSTPILNHVTFSNNQVTGAGGGMVNDASSPVLTDVTFSSNSATQGGGMYNTNGSDPVLNGVSFSGNNAVVGGGMANFLGSDPSLTDVTFSSNTVPGGQGGGMFNDSSSPSLTHVTFDSNSAGSGGWGGAMSNSTANPTLSDVLLASNYAYGNGGALYNTGSDPTLTDVTFDGNWTDHGNGGGVYNTLESNPNLTNVTFTGNSGVYGGALANYANSNPLLTNVTFYGNSAVNFGGAIHDDMFSSPTLLNITMNGNTASIGGGIYNDVSSAPEIYESIFWPGTSSIVNNGGSTSIIQDSLLAGICPVGATCTRILIATDPLLYPLADNGGLTKTMALAAGSPAVDYGGGNHACASTDQRGVTRPQGEHCDIGALERVLRLREADFESDGISDMAYFHPAPGLWGILKSSLDFSYSEPRFITWGQTGDIIVPGDYDGDGSSDPTVRRPPAGGQSAAYMMLLSSTGYDYGSALTIPAGWPGLSDTPVVGDYNGDSISEPAIWRGNTGVWIIPLSPTFNTYQFYSWGQSGDTPIGADVDGDGHTDIGYWRPSTGVWGFLQSSQGYSYAYPLFFSWGSSGNIPVIADYDGDGLADPAVVIPPESGQSRAYRILLSTLAYDPAQSMTVPAGWPGLNDTPVPADYDGDYKADAGIWRQNTGVWIIPKSSTNNTQYMFASWGASGDQIAR